MNESFDTKSIIYKSQFDKNFLVVISSKWITTLRDDAICDLKKKVIIINGNVADSWDKEHFLCVEAHEICHFIAGHDKYDKTQYEKEADKMAYYLLLLKRKYKAAKIIRSRFETLYNINICHFSLRKKLIFKLFFFLIKKIF